MRIAVYHNQDFGGALRVMEEYVRRLSKNHEVDLFQIELDSRPEDIYGIKPPRGSDFDLSSLVKKIRRFPDPRTRFPRSGSNRLKLLLRILDLPGLERAQRAMAAEIDSGGYDVVYVQPCRLTQTPLILRHLRTPTVFYCPEPNRLVFERRLTALAEGRDPGLRLALRRMLLYPIERMDVRNTQAATKVICNSLFTAKQIRICYGREPELHYPGVDSAIFRDLGLLRERRVVFVSALGPNKDQLTAVRAIATIPQEKRPRLILAYNRCSDSYRSLLVTEARRLSVDLELREGLDDAAVVDLYNRSRLAMFTPVWEPFGLIPLEAMACGTPLVGVAEGGLLETVEHEKTGLLVPRDPDQIGKAVASLLDPDSRWQEMSLAGIEAVDQKWKWDITAARLEGLLLEAASSQH